MAPEQQFVEFQRVKGKECTALGDMDWKEVEDFLAKIPTDIERVEFLEVVKGLPDDGVSQGYVRDPSRHNRNRKDFLAPLRKKRSELLSRHFDLDAILAQEIQIVDHGEAIRYLHDVKEDYLKYHPNLVAGGGQNAEWKFLRTLERRIERRKDLRSTEMQGPINITGDGNAVGNQNAISVNKTTVTSGATVADFTALLTQLRAALDGAELDEDTRQVVESDLDVVEGQIVKDKPSKSIVEAKLASMASMAKNAAAIGAAATGLMPLIQKAIEMAHHLF